jgi:hypothetical protein
VASRQSEAFPYPDTADAAKSTARPAAVIATVSLSLAVELDPALRKAAVSTAYTPANTVSTTGQALLVVHVK